MSARPALTGRRPGRAAEQAFRVACTVAAYAPIAVLVWVLAEVAVAGLGRLSWDFLTSPPSRLAGRAGIYPALMGTLWLIVTTAVLALPVGVGAAVFLEEYGRRSRLAAVVEVAIANLASVPSIIYGMLGLGLFVRALALGETVIAGALTLAILILPVVIISTREALRAVDDRLREAALGLGATRWQTTWRVVLPEALPGILTGAILAISRAIGETAPLVLVAGVAFIAFAPDGLDAEYTTLPLQIFRWTTMPQREFVVDAAAAILVLLVALLAINAAAIVLRDRARRR